MFKRAGIPLKFMLGVNSLALILSLITLLVIRSAVQRHVAEGLTVDRDRIPLVLAQFVDSRRAQMDRGLAFLVGASDFQALVGADGIDHDTYLFTLQNLQSILKADVLVLTGVDGKVRARTDRRGDSGEPLTSVPSVRAALEGKSGPGVWSVDGQLYQTFCHPVVIGERVSGSVLVGMRIDQSCAETLKGMLSREVLLLKDDAVVSSTVDQDGAREVAEALPALRGPGGGEPSLIADRGVCTVGGRDYLGMEAALDGRTPIGTAGGLTAVVLADRAAFYGFYDRMQMILIALGVGAQVLAAVFSYLLASRGIAAPIRKMAALLKDVADGEGDLTWRMPDDRGDEIGLCAKSLNAFVSRLRTIIADVRDAANQVGEASEQLSSTSAEMRRDLSDHSKEVLQVSAAVEEMHASVEQVSQRSREAGQRTSAAGSAASEGCQIVEGTVQEIGVIADNVMRASETITALGGKGEQIGRVVQTIDDIAEQTNLLALNAAIEAARAGEHGRGFSVVADEVRKLAERTQLATEEVSRSIKEIRQDTQAAIGQVNSGRDRVSKGVEMASSAGRALGAIVQSAKAVANEVGAIVAVAQEQSTTSEGLARSVNSISEAAQRADHGAERVTASAEALAQSSRRLRQIIGKFKIEAEGPASPAK